jgi:chromosome segregation ATPase
VPEQLQTALARYEALGYTPDQITPLAELSARIETLGLSVDDVADLVAEMQRLRTLGLDASRAEALATAVELAGIPEGQRAGVLAEVVEKGVIHVSLPALRAEREALRQDAQQLRDEHAQLEHAVATARDELTRVQQEEAATRERVGTLQATATQLEDALAAAQALEAFLRGLDPEDRLLTHVAKIAEIQQKHPGRLVALERILAQSVRTRIREFLLRVSAPPSPPPTSMPGAVNTPADR